MNHNRKVLPPVYFLIAVLLMTGFNFFVPIQVILQAPATYLGAGLVVVGFAVVIWPAAAFGKSGTAIKPFEKSTHLVTGGMYRITRNPMYLGMTIVLLGVALLFGTVSPFLLVPLFVVLIQRNFIVHEEAALEETFGNAYRQYRQRVRRWL